jgi:predicted nucleotidyltransferase
MVRDKTPEPPTNPPEPKYHQEKHDFRHPEEDMLDGVGRHEMEKVDFEPFVVIHREYECNRSGCDATVMKRLLFAMEDVMDDEWAEEDVEKVYASIDRVDKDILEVKNPEDDESVRVEPRKILIPEKPQGACNGETDRPSPM